MVSSQMMCVAPYAIFSPKWKGHMHILHIQLAAMELPTLTTEISFQHGLRFGVQQSMQQIVPPHPMSWMTTERRPTVAHRLHPVFSQFTAHTECAMASRSCSNVNHQSTHSPSSHPAFLFHQELLFTTMGVSCTPTVWTENQHCTKTHDFLLIDSTGGGTLDAAKGIA